jgi:LAS superfamily LD-carboxypeptidase LdcB
LDVENLLGLRKPHGLLLDKTSGQFAQAEVMGAYWRLKERAAHDGWDLILVSGYRSFKNQRRIWNYYSRLRSKKEGMTSEKTAKAVMTTVSVPGFSRHQWGTELDISEESLRGQLATIGPDTPKKTLDFYAWMETNAPGFGFCRIYRGGHGAVEDEPWHWSYIPYSRTYQSQFMEIEDFTRVLDKSVMEMDYIRANVEAIRRRELHSVSDDCAP